MAITLPFDEPIDTPAKTPRKRPPGQRGAYTPRAVTAEDEGRWQEKWKARPGAPRGLKDIPAPFRKPLAPPGVKR